LIKPAYHHYLDRELTVKKISHILSACKEFLPLLPKVARFKPPVDESHESLGKMLDVTVSKYPNNTAVVFEGRELSWQQLNSLANQYSHLIKQQGVVRGDCVALYMQNRIEYLACFLGMAKLGVTAALINSSLTGKQLIHCINIVDNKKIIVGEELFQNIKDVQSELSLSKADLLWVQDKTFNNGITLAPEGVLDVGSIVPTMPTDNFPETQSIKAKEKVAYVFTSGTTGLPKAAVITNRRFLTAAIPYSQMGFRAKPTDRLYMCLPLYHITGLGIGVGACVHSGAAIVLRRNFSASAFWPEVKKENTNLFVYVGELCRYLANQPECEAEKNNPITTMMGNGLRPDIWDQFRVRFDVKRISELYGSSEGSVAFLNFFNRDYTFGTTLAPVMLAKYDVDTDELIRDKNGKIIEVAKGETGLLLGGISEKYKFDGYQSTKASNSKVLHDVKDEGDKWFNTGDLIKQVDVGFTFGFKHYQFVDRVGDTFRWRSENVSTNEVGEILNACNQIEVANVYGVQIQGTEGKAGMAAITLKSGRALDLAAISKYVADSLPAYSRPVFLRIQQAQEETQTFKLLKNNLRNEAFNLDKTDDPIFVLKPRSNQYEPLDKDYYQTLLAGNGGY